MILLPAIRVAAVLYLTCRHTGYGNVFFCKTFVDHGTGADDYAAGNLDFSENLYAGPDPYVIAYGRHAAGQDVLPDVHALVNIAKIADAGAGVHYEQAVVVDAQAVTEHVAGHAKTQLLPEAVMPPLPVCQRQ